MSELTTQYTTGFAPPWYTTRWWLRSRPCTMPEGGHGQELYVPYWALPLDWVHRLVMGEPALIGGGSGG